MLNDVIKMNTNKIFVGLVLAIFLISIPQAIGADVSETVNRYVGTYTGDNGAYGTVYLDFSQDGAFLIGVLIMNQPGQNTQFGELFISKVDVGNDETSLYKGTIVIPPWGGDPETYDIAIAFRTCDGFIRGQIRCAGLDIDAIFTADLIHMKNHNL